ncbi:MAG: adenylate/guanylate cyclase domain-containing protein, partial [Lutimonas sp.]
MPQSSRHLAAIMFTDIVGYTALMDKDEDAAFEMLEKNRAIHNEIIKKYRGKFLKEMGDGILASFQTVTDAIYSAGYIQRACENEVHLNLRIGIHQG